MDVLFALDAKMEAKIDAGARLAGCATLVIETGYKTAACYECTARK